MNNSHLRNQRIIYLAVVIIWLVLLFIVTTSIVVLDLQHAETDFYKHADLQYQQANDRVHVIESILDGFTAMLSVSTGAGSERVRSYAKDMLERYPHIFMFEIVEKVAHENLAAFTEYYRQSMYPDYTVKGFSYGSDRQWQPVGAGPYHMPIVFMEPCPEESREVLGLDLGSNDFFVRALQQSERLNRPVSSEPFTLVEGDLAYVIHRPVVLPDNQIARRPQQSGAEREFALLVIHADSLLDRVTESQPGMRELLYHPRYSEVDPAGYLYLQESAPVSWLESIVFPRLRSSRQLDSASQPFVLVNDHQLGWWVISWWKLGAAGLLAAFTFIVMMIYARLYFRNEMARAERYLQIARAIIIGLDRNGAIALINHRGCEILGYDEQELLGKNWFETALPDNVRDKVYAHFRRLIAGEAGPSNRYENPIVTRHGELRYIDWNNELERNRKGGILGTLSCGIDITERKRAEEDAQRHQRDMSHIMRLDTMGEMATGMAHELNQPLTAIISYCGAAETLVKSLPAPPAQLGELLSLAREQAHRAGDFIRHLREFVSKEDADKELLDLDQLIQGVIVFLKWEVQHSGIRIEFLPDGQARKVRAGRIQIEQVIINLLRNSLEAIASGQGAAGRITVKTRVTPDDNIEVTVADNGPGVEASMLDRLFEQFQTSKKAGMGIGLSLSRTIIESDGGRLWVDKHYREGALFGFALPVAG
jgi:PAS domain S-box-containing protein